VVPNKCYLVGSREYYKTVIRCEGIAILKTDFEIDLFRGYSIKLSEIIMDLGNSDLEPPNIAI